MELLIVIVIVILIALVGRSITITITIKSRNAAGRECRASVPLPYAGWGRAREIDRQAPEGHREIGGRSEGNSNQAEALSA
jgi:hypothetical protein